MDSYRLEGCHLLRGSSLSSGNDRAGMSHPSSWRSGLPGNEADDGFADVWEKRYVDNLNILDGNNEESDLDKDGLTFSQLSSPAPQPGLGITILL